MMIMATETKVSTTRMHYTAPWVENRRQRMDNQEGREVLAEQAMEKVRPTHHVGHALALEEDAQEHRFDDLAPTGSGDHAVEEHVGQHDHAYDDIGHLIGDAGTSA